MYTGFVRSAQLSHQLFYLLGLLAYLIEKMFTFPVWDFRTSEQNTRLLTVAYDAFFFLE